MAQVETSGTAPGVNTETESVEGALLASSPRIISNGGQGANWKIGGIADIRFTW